MAELGEPWPDADAEYTALTELLVPAAYGRYDQALHAWEATETKALGFLAIAVAIIAGLTSARDSRAATEAEQRAASKTRRYYWVWSFCPSQQQGRSWSSSGGRSMEAR